MCHLYTAIINKFFLETLYCGYCSGTGLSDAIARRSISYILPRLNHNEEAEESWEILDTKPVGEGAQSLRWLVWVSNEDSIPSCLCTSLFPYAIEICI